MIWHHQYYGPYHLARVRKLAPTFHREGLELIPLQLFDRQDIYRWDDTDTHIGFSCLHLPSLGKDRMRWRDGWPLMRSLDGLRPDLVFVNGWGMRDSLIIHLWCRWRGVPRVLVSDSQLQDSPRGWLKERLKSWLVKGCNAGFVAGAPQRRYLMGLGFAGDAIFDGCDVVDNAHFARAMAGSPDRQTTNTFRLLTVARW